MSLLETSRFASTTDGMLITASKASFQVSSAFSDHQSRILNTRRIQTGSFACSFTVL